MPRNCQSFRSRLRAFWRKCISPVSLFITVTTLTTIHAMFVIAFLSSQKIRSGLRDSLCFPQAFHPEVTLARIAAGLPQMEGAAILWQFTRMQLSCRAWQSESDKSVSLQVSLLLCPPSSPLRNLFLWEFLQEFPWEKRILSLCLLLLS